MRRGQFVVLQVKYINENYMNKNSFHPATIFSTFFWIGKIPLMPGTLGSMAAFPLWYIIAFFASLRGYQGYFAGNGEILSFSLFIIFILFVFGAWSAGIYEKLNNKQDPGEVVIDEVVGQLLVISISIFLLPFFFADKIEQFRQLNLKTSIIFDFLLLCDFIYFRLFDIIKPWPIKMVDQKIKGGLGIMLDDIAAVPFSLILALGTVDIFIEIITRFYR